MLSDIFTDPIGAISGFLLAVPGLLLALCAHEAAHGLAAYWCGDPTAKYYGRITLNPMKHLDPMGTLCMLFLHIGWAKPVPVNPNNFRNPRRDDFFVSIAGITANLLLFLLSCIVLYVPVTLTLRDMGGRYMDCLPFYQMAYAMPSFIGDVYGPVMEALCEILVNAAMINLSLACFNLLPIPPLDGYHVLNDLILRGRSAFPSGAAARIGRAIILLLVFVPQLSALYSRLLTGVFSAAFSAAGSAAYALLQLVGIM